ncbi:MAG: hypothetical protein QGF59_29670 [Pirellulaceae bacterium]|nr:hypothetical protein [Pirellulaceae bacterium]
MKLQQSMLWLSIVAVLGMSGCSSLPIIAYIAGGTIVPPQFDGLEASRVAVICISDDSSYGSGTESKILAREISSILAENVTEIDLVRSSEIADWIDRKGWDEIDYREVGRGVKADRVVAVDLSGLRVREGASMFRGRADLTITVFDMNAGGKEVFRRELIEFSYPSSGPFPAVDISEARFSQRYLKVLASEVAKYFHEYDTIDEHGAPFVF